MKRIDLKRFGPIHKADVTFGDLTLLVGPQATGKSLFLQVLKLIVDKKHIRKTLEQYGFPWRKDVANISELYFGSGMAKVWTESTSIEVDGKSYPSSLLLPRQRESIVSASEKVFYVPAQRVLCLENGWPKFFSGFDASVPYVLRHYSETLRLYMDSGMDQREEIFPAKNRLKEPLRNAFTSAIYQGGKINLDVSQGKKQFILEVNKSKLPFMTWSAGQKEFMPLLLSFYYLSPPSKVSKKDEFEYVILEEPEMGLHPKAITAIILQVIDLMSRGYKVIVSTHSPVFLEFAWAFKYLKNSSPNNYKNMMELFGIKKGPPSLLLMFENLMRKTISSYFFERVNNSVEVRDISSLDAGSEDDGISEWGGLSSFSTKASEIVSKAIPL